MSDRNKLVAFRRHQEMRPVPLSMPEHPLPDESWGMSIGEKRN